MLTVQVTVHRDKLGARHRVRGRPEEEMVEEGMDIEVVEVVEVVVVVVVVDVVDVVEVGGGGDKDFSVDSKSDDEIDGDAKMNEDVAQDGVSGEGDVAE
eukprot:11431125-Ditylum_brightwellii.AAC.1